MGNKAIENSSGLAMVEAIQLAMENLPVAVAIFEFEGRPVYANRCFRLLHDLDSRWITGNETFLDLVETDRMSDWKQDPKTFFENVQRELAAGRSVQAQIEVGDKIIAVHDMMLDDRHILTTQQDVTARVQAERRVSYLAHHDPMTDLPNRIHFSARLESLIEESKVTRRRFGVMSFDVDRFKDINDLFGHNAGDIVLTELARRMKTVLGPQDFAARLGGDEFTVISTGDSQPETVTRLAENLAQAMDEDIEVDGRSLRVALSIGIAMFPQDGNDAATLLANADAALYRAKSEGRGRFCAFNAGMDRRMHDRRVLQQDLRHALGRQELALYYQPQASVSGEIFGFEALLRWQHPSRGLITPDHFVPLAEESGLIVEIGRWVLREACREAASWPNQLKIAINVSPIQFRQEDLVRDVHAILLNTGLSPERLELEITEGVLVQDFARALQILRGLKALGIQIAMDDFGTGYSSLSYLQAFPFDTIKIDKSFTAKLSTDTSADEIVRAVIGLGRGLNIPIVAEGVETEEQRVFLEEAQCQHIQGFLIGKAEPIAEYAQLTGADAEASVPAPQPTSATITHLHRR
ncbi:EAL domain-containing protein [Rhizobiales bacterium RZME27]|uniref:EAL domain-containing protein n=1 Tax=Endobacterium cereale TaxID=2663029 RepID=A0A6A8A3E6_9HYPH|nr:EAL domain-containing protein [Endobacterium cereale]MEB2844631.1 EAL domain-containing protein [Endobacterium cereale]MQY45054.1 EAL domain-containing protein [Endobacterium cereale]